MQKFSQYIKESNTDVPQDIRSETVFVHSGPDGQIVMPKNRASYLYWIKPNETRPFYKQETFILISPDQTKVEMSVAGDTGVYNSNGVKISGKPKPMAKIQSLVDIAFSYWLHNFTPSIALIKSTIDKLKLDPLNPSIIDYAKKSPELALYIVHLAGRPIAELEPILAKQSASAFLYARLTGKKFELGEPAINRVDRYSQQYNKMFGQLDEDWNSLSVLPNNIRQFLIHKSHHKVASTDTVVQLRPTDDPIKVWSRLGKDEDEEDEDDDITERVMAVWYSPVDHTNYMILDDQFWTPVVYNSQFKRVGDLQKVFDIGSIIPFHNLSSHNIDGSDVAKIKRYTTHLFSLGYKCWLIIPTRQALINARSLKDGRNSRDPLNWKGRGPSLDMGRASISLRGRSMPLIDKVIDKLQRELTAGGAAKSNAASAATELKKVTDAANVGKFEKFENGTRYSLKDYKVKVAVLDRLNRNHK